MPTHSTDPLKYPLLAEVLRSPSLPVGWSDTPSSELLQPLGGLISCRLPWNQPHPPHPPSPDGEVLASVLAWHTVAADKCVVYELTRKRVLQTQRVSTDTQSRIER